ncbi:hypothetical protein B0H19DRAFT_1084994 [Mycena capillaripes]|nr:hypothetical protein B0H19DRAFT_1084994 [Mycena capillaripes]
MQFTHFVAFVLAVVDSASAICADGQIGIGAEQLSSIGSPGTGSAPGPISGFIWANNCGTIASNNKDGPCGGGYSNGASVQCNGGNPISARTGDGTSWTCVGGGGQNCGLAPFGTTSVWTCCNRN